MKFRKLYYLTALLIASPSVSLRAQRHEISGHSNWSFGYHHGDNSTLKQTQFAIGYDHLLTKHFQLGGQSSYTYYRISGTGFHYFSLGLGPTYNFSDRLEDSFYLKLLAGFNYSRTSYSPYYLYRDRDWYASIAFGKRFRLAENVSFKPNINYVFTEEGSYSHHHWSFVPLSLSVLFD